ncbi:hypothetical protein RFI_22892 [Reticulomyxa filosa]|uniref:Uncharacterized protein n=1 Tax=Reticulomyxa filosa TaxID=46433 RepID=X6MM16_RETFI|nr:hypothetical protein RFI_22892 [Reticulomyxa filosa]|eukprot:ETO14477.1 hypothetical protein RFI_22892 [Reticulomyxa filosa]
MLFFRPGASQRVLDPNVQNEGDQGIPTAPRTVAKNTGQEQKTRHKGRRPFGADLTNTSLRVNNPSENGAHDVLKTAHVDHRRSKREILPTPDWFRKESKPLRLDSVLLLDEDGDVMMTGLTKDKANIEADVTFCTEMGPKKGDEWMPSVSKEVEQQLNDAFDAIAKYRRPFTVNQDKNVKNKITFFVLEMGCMF